MTSWRSEDQESLRKALQSRGLDETSLARSSAISLAQLRELLQGGEGQFYSADIKAHVGHKLMRRLGLEPAPQPAVAETSPDPAPAFAVRPAVVSIKEQGAESAHASRRSSAPAAPMAARFGAGAGVLLLGVLAAGAFMMPAWRAPGGQLRSHQDLDDRPTMTPSASPVMPTRLPDRAADASMAAVTTPVSPVQETPLQHLTSVNPPCDWSKASASASFQTEGPTKAGNYVHFVAERTTIVCVVDQAHKVTQLQLKEGEARSVYGEGPFLVHLQEDAGVKLFFQGRRVPMSPASGLMVLQPVPLG